MFNKNIFIIFCLCVNMQFVLASDPSAYEAAILRISNELEENRQNLLGLGLGCYDQEYEKMKLDEAEVIIKDFFGLGALSQFRPFRHRVEMAPFRDKIVLIKDGGHISLFWLWGNPDGVDTYKLASSPKLNVVYISSDMSFCTHSFYPLKKAGRRSNGVLVDTLRLIKGAVEIRIPTHMELIQIREDVAERSVIISHTNTGGTLAIVDRQIAMLKEAAWEGRKPWLVAVEQAKRAVHGMQTSAVASAAASSEDLK